MVEIILDYYFYQQSYSSLKSKNVVKFCVHISPIFSCPVIYVCTHSCVYVYQKYLCMCLYDKCMCLCMCVTIRWILFFIVSGVLSLYV